MVLLLVANLIKQLVSLTLPDVSSVKKADFVNKERSKFVRPELQQMKWVSLNAKHAQLA